MISPKNRQAKEIFTEYLSNEFYEIRSNGIIADKTKTITEITNESPPEFILSNFEFKYLTKNIVILHYIASKTDPTSIKKSKSMRTSIWKKIKNRWRMIFHQGTKIIE